MMFKPYISVTGAYSQQQIKNIVEWYPADASRQLVIGVLVTDKTFHNRDKKNQPLIYPMMKDIPSIPIPRNNVSYIIHYCPNQDNPDMGFRMVEIACSDANGNRKSSRQPGMHHFSGFQINASWPDQGNIVSQFWSRSFGPRKLILQIGRQALSEINNDPLQLVERLIYGYTDIIDGILIDPSGGEGREFDPEKMDNYLRAIYEATLGINVAIAGGFGNDGSVARLLWPLAKKYPDLSICAQNKLLSNDELDEHKVIGYISDALKVFSQA